MLAYGLVVSSGFGFAWCGCGLVWVTRFWVGCFLGLRLQVWLWLMLTGGLGFCVWSWYNVGLRVFDLASRIGWLLAVCGGF